jgi:hypothetical protein
VTTSSPADRLLGTDDGRPKEEDLQGQGPQPPGIRMDPRSLRP